MRRISRDRFLLRVSPSRKTPGGGLGPRIRRRNGGSADLRQTPPKKIEQDPARCEYILTEPWLGIASGPRGFRRAPFVRTWAIGAGFHVFFMNTVMQSQLTTGV
jgi:hypothetical protein